MAQAIKIHHVAVSRALIDVQGDKAVGKFALPLALLGTFLFHWPVMLVDVIVMSDEIVKAPWIYPCYKKRLWKKNITREET